MSDQETNPDPQRHKILRRKVLMGVTLGAVGLGLGLGAAIRWGPTTETGRKWIETALDGQGLGRFGTLGVSGLEGDIWSSVRLKHLSVADKSGVWLRADNLAVDWQPQALLGRELDLTRVHIGRLSVLRSPQLGPETEQKPPPLGVRVRDLKLDLYLDPAVTGTQGAWAIGGHARSGREGDTEASLAARSLTRAGDGAALEVALGKAKSLILKVQAREAKGGPIAALVGLAKDQAFEFALNLSGEPSGPEANPNARGTFSLKGQSGDKVFLSGKGQWHQSALKATLDADLNASRLTEALAARLGPDLKATLFGQPTGQDQVARNKNGSDKKAPVLIGQKPVAWDVSLRAETVSAILSANGKIIPEKRRTGEGGVQVSLKIPQLNRLYPSLFGTLALEGPLQADLSESVPDLQWSGALSGQGGHATYRLARVDGTISARLKAKETDLRLKIAGQGGRFGRLDGKALDPRLGRVLGAQPKAEAWVHLDTANRWQIRDLKLDGRAVRVRGEGGPALMGGGLTFRGEARLTDLSAVLPGQTGQLVLSGTARQGPGSKVNAAASAWSLSATLRGQGVRWGQADLQAVLGDNPDLSARGRVDMDGFYLDQAQFKAAQFKAKGSGQMAAKSGLDFVFDWSAGEGIGEKSLALGPIILAGDLRGAGRLFGPAGSPNVTLTAALDQLDLPRLPLRQAKLDLTIALGATPSGRLDLVADSEWGPAKARSGFGLAGQTIQLSDLFLQAGGVTAAGAARLSPAGVESADLSLRAGPGAFLRAGSVQGVAEVRPATDGPSVSLNLTGAGVRLSPDAPVIDRLQLAAKGPMTELDLDVTAKGRVITATARDPFSAPLPWSITSQGRLEGLGGKPEQLLRLSLSRGEGAWNRVPVRLLSPARLTLQGESQALEAAIGVGTRGRLEVQALLGAQSATLTAKAADLPAGMLDPDLDGRLGFNASVSGSGRAAPLSGPVQLDLSEVRGRGEPVSRSVTAQLSGQLAKNRLSLDLKATTPQGLSAASDLSVPVDAQVGPLKVGVDLTQSVSGRFQAEGPVGPVFDLLVGGDRTLEGQATLSGTLGGSLREPEVSGQFAFRDGTFRDALSGLQLKTLTLAADFTQSRVDLKSLTASDGAKGGVSGQGAVSLVPGGESDLRLNLTGFRVIETELATASASGEARILRDPRGQIRIRGALFIDRADLAPVAPQPAGIVPLEVIEVNRPGHDLRPVKSAAVQSGQAPAATGRPEAPPVRLDLSLKAPRRIFVEGRGLSVEMGLEARVSGLATAPLLSGTARVIRGDYDFAGKRFVFDDDSTVWLSADPDKMRLDLTARREAPGLTAEIRVTGSASRPKIALSSSPALPQDEILSQVLFGTSANQLSPLEAAQLASAVAGLAGGGGFDVIGNLRNLTGLDRLTLAGQDAASLSLAGGKYLTDDVYLEIIGGGRDGTAAQLEWRVSRSLAIVSRLGSSNSRLSVRWRQER
ncbi:MAG: translocation/assembly module TamB domain-containing protein [Asticcacaulis sp.]